MISLQQIGLLIVILAIYRTIEKYGWVPIRNRIVGWLAAKVPAFKKIAAFVQKY